MPNTIDTCGCVSNDSHWIKLCAAHQTERAAALERAALSSLRYLMRHYDRFPTEDNLRHVITRIKEVGSAVSGDHECTVWIKGRRDLILKAAKAAAGT